eukprot:1198350-Prymnesium_polylepis.4
MHRSSGHRSPLPPPLAHRARSPAPAPCRSSWTPYRPTRGNSTDCDSNADVRPGTVRLRQLTEGPPHPRDPAAGGADGALGRAGGAGRDPPASAGLALLLAVQLPAQTVGLDTDDAAEI